MKVYTNELHVNDVSFNYEASFKSVTLLYEFAINLAVNDNCYIMYTDTKNKINAIELLDIKDSLFIRKLFTDAIKYSAFGFFIVYRMNEADFTELKTNNTIIDYYTMYQLIRRKMDIVGIGMLDLMLVSDSNYISMKEREYNE